MTKGGSDILEETTALYRLMIKWVNESIERAICRGSMEANVWKLCLGVVAWGDKYTDLFLNYCVPSLMNFGNLPGIADSPIWIVIHTDKESLQKIKNSPALRILAEMNVCIEIHTIPEGILSELTDNPADKYRLLAAAHNIQMQMAKYLGYGYHMLMPDHVYSGSYFTNLRQLAQSNDAIVQGALSADIDEAYKELKNDGVLNLSVHELNTIALRNLHGMFKPYVMNGRDYKKDCPINNFLIFIASDTVRILCPHMSIAYLSHKVLSRCPMRLFNTIDTQLPFFIPQWASVIVPKKEHDMAYIELSGNGKNNYIAPKADIRSFAIRFWMLVCCEESFLRYLDMETDLPITDTCGYQPHTHEYIDMAFSDFRKSIKENYAVIKAELAEEYQKDPLPQRAA